MDVYLYMVAHLCGARHVCAMMVEEEISTLQVKSVIKHEMKILED